MVKDYLKQLGNELRALRKHASLTQEELADRSGLNANYIGRIERGEINVTIQTLSRIARAMNAELSDIFEPDEDAELFSGDRVKRIRNEINSILLKADLPTLTVMRDFLRLIVGFSQGVRQKRNPNRPPSG